MTQPRAFHEAPLPLFDPDEAVGEVLPGKLPSYIADHRKRLRSRFLEGGAQAMPDYELLELVLFRAIPEWLADRCGHRDRFKSFAIFRHFSPPIRRAG